MIIGKYISLVEINKVSLGWQKPILGFTEGLASFAGVMPNMALMPQAKIFLKKV